MIAKVTMLLALQAVSADPQPTSAEQEIRALIRVAPAVHTALPRRDPAVRHVSTTREPAAYPQTSYSQTAPSFPTRTTPSLPRSARSPRESSRRGSFSIPESSRMPPLPPAHRTAAMQPPAASTPLDSQPSLSDVLIPLDAEPNTLVTSDADENASTCGTECCSCCGCGPLSGLRSGCVSCMQRLFASHYVANQGLRRPLYDWLFSNCEMPPHNAYILLEPDTYYFRPYNQVHLGQQAIMVTKWGGDPRHPYANALFDRVYTQWEAEHAKPEVVPVPDPSETPDSRNDAGSDVPPTNQSQDVPPDPNGRNNHNSLRDDTDNGSDSQGG